MLFASILINEVIAWQQFAGAILIISGVYLTTQLPRLDKTAGRQAS